MPGSTTFSTSTVTEATPPGFRLGDCAGIASPRRTGGKVVRVSSLRRHAKLYPQPFQQSLWTILPRDAQGPQTSILFEFNQLVVGTQSPVVRRTRTPQVFCRKYRGNVREPSAQRKLVADKLKVGKAQVVQQQERGGAGEPRNGAAGQGDLPLSAALGRTR